MQPFPLAVDQPCPLTVTEQDTLARALHNLRRHYVARGFAQTTFERAAFHRCVAYDAEASEPEIYLREAVRRG